VDKEGGIFVFQSFDNYLIW